MRVPFIGGHNTNRSVNVSAERLVNMFLEPGGKYPGACYQRPGLKSFANAGSSVVRGLCTFEGDLYAVVGGDLKKITTAGVVTTAGSIGTTSGPVCMSTNAAATPELLILDGAEGYIWDGTNLTAIADADFPDTATHCDYIDGYFVVNDPTNKGRFYISAVNDGTTWGATDFATAERDPDKLVALIVNHRELILFGERTTEFWANTGNQDFPFENIQSGFTEVGIAAAHSQAKIGGVVYWLATSEQGQGAAFRASGLQGTRISTESEEQVWAGYSTISDAIGATLYMQGHAWYILTFPTADATWVYDELSKQWYEWSTGVSGRWRANTFVFFNNKYYVGDYQDGSIFELDFDTYTDQGETVVRARRDRHIISASNHNPVFHRALELEFETGVGKEATSDNPQIALRWSDDGGSTFSNWHTRGLGKSGARRTRAVWRALGRSRDRVYEIRKADDAKTAMISGYLDLNLGRG